MVVEGFSFGKTSRIAPSLLLSPSSPSTARSDPAVAFRERNLFDAPTARSR
jgi:hypothetical protein